MGNKVMLRALDFSQKMTEIMDRLLQQSKAATWKCFRQKTLWSKNFDKDTAIAQREIISKDVDYNTTFCKINFSRHDFDGLNQNFSQFEMV